MRSFIKVNSHHRALGGLAAAACLSLCAISGARAQSIVYDDNTGTAVATTNEISHLTELDYTVNSGDFLHFIQFDTSHGTLISASIQYVEFEITTTSHVTNDNSPLVTGDTYSTSDLFVDGNGITYPGGDTFPDVAHLETAPENFSLTQGQSATLGPDTASASGQPIYTFSDAPTLGLLTGNATFDQGVLTQTFTVKHQTGGNVTVDQTTSAKVQAIITYVYATDSAAPEPSAGLLAGFGTLAGGFIRYRRLRRKNKK